MKKKCTKEKVYDFILQFYEDYGYYPTIREICDGLDVSSTSTIHAHLKKLKESGALIKESNKNRVFSIPNTRPESINIPLIGEIAAGKPILAQEIYDEFISIPSNFFPNGELFVLSVKGDSMIEAGIFSGDKIVVRKQCTAHDGDIVAALLDGDSVTVKRFFKENGHVRLKPENSSMKDILCKDVTIIGKVVGLMRSM